MSEGERSIGFPKLMNQIHGFRALITPNGSDFGLPLTGETLEWNVRHILTIHSDLVVCPKNEVSHKLPNNSVILYMQNIYLNVFIGAYCPFSNGRR